MAQLDVKAVLGDALVLPLVAVDVPRGKSPGVVRLGIERHQVPEFARLMGDAGPQAEVAVLPADLALALLDELDHLDRHAPRLLAPGAARWFHSSIGDDLALEASGAAYSATFYFRRFPHVTRYGTDRGGLWWGWERRRDAAGRWWQTTIKDLVMDDFGFLVPADGGVL